MCWVILGQNVQFECTVWKSLFCCKMKATYIYSPVSIATIKAYTDGGAGQVCRIDGGERDRYGL